MPGDQTPTTTSDRKQIRVGSDPDSIRVLTTVVNSRSLPGVYVHDGHPVLVEHTTGATILGGDEDAPPPVRVSELRAATLAGLLADHCEVVRARSVRGELVDEEITPPAHVLGAVLARSRWDGLPVLTQVINTPVLRPDGSLLQHPGYDPVTGFYLAGRPSLPVVPERPTDEQVSEAKTFLTQTFLGDFPWRAPADKANYLGLLVSPILRPFLRAPQPFAVVDATMPGSGKTILTSCVGLLVGQKVLTWTDNDEELRKAVTSVLADSAGVVVFDNLVEGHVISSPVLARLVTEKTWTDRRLGSNATMSFVQDRLWMATGNNLHTGGDMASRSVWVRLDPDCPRPEARTGFTIPSLDTWILDPENQNTVLFHLLILVASWTTAGAPSRQNAPAMRQFTKWAAHIAGFLDHHGLGGAFLTNAEDARELDDDDAEWEAFLHTWVTNHQGVPMTAAALLKSAEPDLGETDPWYGTFPTTATGRTHTTKSLSALLRGHVGRWHGHYVLRTGTDKTRKIKTFLVQTPETKPGKPGNPGKGEFTRLDTF